MRYHLIHYSKFDSPFEYFHTINDQEKLETHINWVLQKARERDHYVSSSVKHDKLVIKVSNATFTQVEKFVIQTVSI